MAFSLFIYGITNVAQAPKCRTIVRMTSPVHDWSQALGLEAADKRLAILQAVGATGSISEAARQSGVSYKAAWQAIETLSNLTGAVLVERAVGGSGGGGAVLTAEGERLLQAAQWLREARTKALTRLSTPHTAAVALTWSGLGLRTSMRNQWPVVVKALRRQAPGMRVELRLDSGETIAAALTSESVQLLDLRVAQSVWALCKATAVAVTAQAPDDAAINLVSGEVTRVARGTVRGSEVSLRLQAGARAGVQVVGFAGAAHGLRVGDLAYAHWPDSTVVLALGE
jgi:molybdate transport system regulatory protein